LYQLLKTGSYSKATIMNTRLSSQKFKKITQCNEHRAQIWVHIYHAIINYTAKYEHIYIMQ
jgi:hypothetical protein